MCIRDRVYPELVIRDPKGEIQGVRYEELAPMLLNEVQQQKREIADQKASIAAQAAQMAAQDGKITAQAQQLHDMQLKVSQIAPELVARAIASAIAAGWEPLSRGKTVEIGVDETGA